MRRDPPLNAIRSFEAAGRLLSVTAAAQELCVTPAAVSRQIKLLEEHLQLPLFVRGHRAVVLTPAGSQYHAEVKKHLDGMRRSTARIMETRGRRTLRIQVHATIATRWLIPRLSSFHSAYPDIGVSLTTSLQASGFNETEYDCAILLGDGQWKGLRTYRLIPNELAPVCKPEILACRPHLRSPKGLARETLLHSLSRPEDWAHWLNAMHVQNVDPYQGLRYDSSVLSYQAAIEGHGIAIAQKVLVDGDIAAGRLTYPYDDSFDMGSYTYYFVLPVDIPASPELEIFRNWVTTQSE
jgi:LysR family glycine cleavage system transcriptional activator